MSTRLRTVDGETEKYCSRCREWWPADLEFFFANPTRAGGLFYCCKACYSEWKTANTAKKTAAHAAHPRTP